MSKESLSKAVDLAHGQSALARGVRAHLPDCKVEQGHVWGWLNSSSDDVPPAEYVIAIAQTVNWKVTPHELRHDIYPHPSDGMPRSLCACTRKKAA